MRTQPVSRYLLDIAAAVLVNALYPQEDRKYDERLASIYSVTDMLQLDDDERDELYGILLESLKPGMDRDVARMIIRETMGNFVATYGEIA